MERLYYVLYSAKRNQAGKPAYIKEDGEFGTYAEAEKHDSPYFTPAFDDVSWCGPCKEGEEP